MLSNDEMDIRTSATTSLVVGVIFMVIGIVVAFMLYASGLTVAVLVGLALIAIGALMVFLASSEHVVLRRGGTSLVEKKRLLGGKTKSQSFETRSVTAVRLITGMSRAQGGEAMNSSSSNSRQSVLSLLLSDNSLVQVAHKSGSGFSVNGLNVGALIQKAPLSAEASQVAQFLGVPLQASDVSSPIAAIRQVADIVGQEFSHSQTSAASTTQPVPIAGESSWPPAASPSLPPRAAGTVVMPSVPPQTQARAVAPGVSSTTEPPAQNNQV